MARHFAIKVTDLVQDQAVKVSIEDIEIAIVLDGNGEIHAIGDTCTHGEVSLSEGFVIGDALECWAHGSAFSLKTGIPENLPAFKPVPVFVVEIEDDSVYIDPTIMKEIN